MFKFCFALLFIAACNGQAQPATTPMSGVQTAVPSPICTKRNGYFKRDGSCDSYVECREFSAKTTFCPEGLNYNQNAQWPDYPCGHPMDVPCMNRGDTQPAKPTADCPHQYGFFPSPKNTPDSCGSYMTCVEGHAFEMPCPAGLAFDEVTERCDWPDLVASCNEDEFLGFKCPAAPVDASGQLLDIVHNYKYEGDCFYFFSCKKGRARLLSCDFGLAFDPVLAKCVNAELVQCSP